jgi:hypothetical protein
MPPPTMADIRHREKGYIITFDSTKQHMHPYWASREGSSELIELSRINKVSFGLQYFTSQTNLFILRSTNTKLHNYTSAPYIHIASAVNSYSV